METYIEGVYAVTFHYRKLHYFVEKNVQMKRKFNEIVGRFQISAVQKENLIKNGKIFFLFLSLKSTQQNEAEGSDVLALLASKVAEEKEEQERIDKRKQAEEMERQREKEKADMEKMKEEQKQKAAPLPVVTVSKHRSGIVK